MYLYRFVLLASFVTFVTFVSYDVKASVTLVSEGIPQGVIIIARDAPDSVRFAADELQNHVYCMSGAKIPVRIEGDSDDRPVIASLGDTQFALKQGITSDQLPPDGFKIREAGKAMIIVGRDHKGQPLGDRKGRLRWTYNKALKINAHGETGTQFGVYRFLHDQGVRWYMPGEIGMVAPKQRNIIFNGQSVDDAPQSTYRMLQGFSFDKDPDAAIWYKRVGYGSIRYININHSFTNWVSRFSETHPEYFARVNGRPHYEIARDEKRVFINYTNPGVLRQVVDDIDEYLKKHPDETIFPVVPNDSQVGHDEGEATQSYIHEKKYSPGWLSDLVWGFVNKVAIEVNQRHPGKEVGSLAYAYQFEAPTMIKKFSPNVVVMHCRRRNQFWNKEYKQYVWDNLRAFTKLGPAHQYVWEYYNLRSRHEKLEWVPFIMPHIIASDIHALKGITEGEFIQVRQSRNSEKLIKPGFYHINLYVTAKALWNPDMDVDALLDEYYRLFYGPAEQPMSLFWGRLESIWATQNSKTERIKPVAPRERNREFQNRWKYYWNELYTADVVDQLYKYLDKAASLVKDKPLYAQRVAFIRRQFQPMRDFANKISGK